MKHLAKQRKSVLTALISLVAMSCESTSTGSLTPPLVLAGDSAGIATVTITGGSFDALPPIEVASTTVFDEDWFRIADVAFVSGGEAVALANVGEREVTIVDLGSRESRRFGQEGSGPGEFIAPIWVSADGAGGFIAFDIAQSRITAWRQGSDEPEVHVVGGTRPSSSPLGVGLDGVLYMGFDEFGPGEDGRVEGTFRVVAYTQEGDPLRELSAFPGREVILVDGQPREPVATSFTSVAVAGDRLWVNTRGGPRIVALSNEGGIERILRLPGFSETPGAEHREKFGAHSLASASSAADSTAVRARLQETLFPATLPVVETVFGEPSGRFWIELFRPPWEQTRSRRYVAFDREGQPTGQLVVEPEVRLFDFSGRRAVGIARDSLDVERVVLLELAPIG